VNLKREEISDGQVLLKVKEIISKHSTYGYRRVCALLRKWKIINHKKVYRVMKENGLLLQPYGPRPARVHDGKIATLKSNLRWCSDGFKIQCWNGEHLEVAFSLDCHDREVMSWVTSTRGIDGELIRDLMAETIEYRFQENSIPWKIQWLTDNGPAYVARETVFFGRSLGFEICTTAPYSPESNGMAEAFVKTFKRDYVYVGDLSSADRVREQLTEWFKDYNENAPHKALGMKAPREYIELKRAS
jgi:transposase InsO family protein